jgi:LmbE family N-acetylglucosaminyl deacetylase
VLRRCVPAYAGIGASDVLSCVLVVSHPDDDAIFAAVLQSRIRAVPWSIVCVTHTRDSDRGRELLNWQMSLGTDPAHIHFLGHRDDPEDWRLRRCTLDARIVERDLRALGLEPKLVVTHNHRGEYRHPHHIVTHEVARKVFPTAPILCFGTGLERTDISIPCPEKRHTLRRFFPSQPEAIGRVVRPIETFSWVKRYRSPNNEEEQALADQLTALENERITSTPE